MQPIFRAYTWRHCLLCVLLLCALCSVWAPSAPAETASRLNLEPTKKKKPCHPGCRTGEFCFHQEHCLPVPRSCREDKDCSGATFCVEVGNNDEGLCLPVCRLDNNKSKTDAKNPQCWKGLGSCFSVSKTKPQEGACYPPQYPSQLADEVCDDEASMTQNTYHTCVEGLLCHKEGREKRCRPKCDPTQSKRPNKTSSHPSCLEKGALCVPLKQGGGVCSIVRGPPQKTSPSAKKPGLPQQIYKGVSEEVRYYLFDADSGVYWLYLLLHLFIGGAFFLLWLNPLGTTSLKDALAYVFPARIYLTRQFYNDACITVLNQTGPIALFLSLEIYTDTVGVFVKQALFSGLGPPAVIIQGGGAAIVLTFVMLLLSDLGAFIAHWMQHNIPVLWEFHKVHHSAETLNPLTNNRSHPVDLLLISNVTGLLIGVGVGVAGYLSNSTLEETTITWINAFLVAAPLILENFQHSHIPISFGRLDYVIMSPLMHQIHHSKAPEHLDKNLAQVFSFWDKMAGTLALPKKGETLSFGVDDDKYDDDFNKLWVIYIMPCVRACQVLYEQSTRLFTKQHRPETADPNAQHDTNRPS